MLRLFRLVVALLMVTALPVAATTLTTPYTFSSGTTISSSQVNANFAAIQGAVNNIDHYNLGANGIYASQIVPTTTGQATFGGTNAYIFPSFVSFGGAGTQGINTPGSGQNVAGIQGTNLCGYNGSAYVWCFDTNGNVGLASGVVAGNGAFASSTTTPVLLCPQSTCSVSVPTTGGLEAEKAGSSVETFVPPAYTQSGGSPGGTMHMAFATCTMAAGNTSCAATFTNSAVFGNNAYTCNVGQSTSGTGATGPYWADTQTTTSLYLFDSHPNSSSATLNAWCFGP